MAFFTATHHHLIQDRRGRHHTSPGADPSPECNRKYVNISAGRMPTNGGALNAPRRRLVCGEAVRPNQHPASRRDPAFGRKLKGWPSTQVEVYALRDNATAVAMPAELVESTEIERGYKEIAPLSSIE